MNSEVSTVEVSYLRTIINAMAFVVSGQSNRFMPAQTSLDFLQQNLKPQ